MDRREGTHGRDGDRDATEETCASRPVPGPTPSVQAHTAWSALKRNTELERSTVERIGPILVTFAARQHTLGRARLQDSTPEDATGFVWARTRRGTVPSIATVHLRRTALRLLNRALAQLGDPMPDITRGLKLPSKTRSELRPLDDDEIGLVRIAATTRHRHATLAMATVALAEATATTGEIAVARWSDIDLGAGTVTLPGAGRIQPRTGQLTGWAITALRRHAHTVTDHPSAHVAYRGQADPASQPAQAAIVNRLSRLLIIAGVDSPDTRPTSIRLWQPAQALAAGHAIEDVARLAGHTSLDVTAAQLHHHWRDR